MTDFFILFWELLSLSKAEKKLLGQLQHTPNTPPTLNLQVSVPLKWFSYKRLKKHGQLRHTDVLYNLTSYILLWWYVQCCFHGNIISMVGV